MPARSAGLLPYRFSEGMVLEVLVVHPGGPFWANKDDGAWSIAKGEYEPGEDPAEAADREFSEELGKEPPGGPRIDLGEVRQPSGKVIRVWAVAGDLDAADIVSNEFEMEWPPRSGTRARFPEIARAKWFAPEEARRKLKAAQVPFLDRLEAALRSAGRL